MADYDLELMKEQGWRVHIKKSGDRKYIIAQRTPPGQIKRVSKSMGRFRQGLWNQLEALEMTPGSSSRGAKNEASRSSLNLQRQIDALKAEMRRFRESMYKRLKALRDGYKEHEKNITTIWGQVDGYLTDLHIGGFPHGIPLKTKILEIENQLFNLSISDLISGSRCSFCKSSDVIILASCLACNRDLQIKSRT